MESSSTHASMVGEDLLGDTLQVVFFTVLCFKRWVKKLCKAKILQGIWERLLYENNHKSNIYKLSNKFTYITVLCFLRNQKQELDFQQVGDLVTGNISVFFYSKPSSTWKVCQIQQTFIKGFLHVILSRTIAPWWDWISGQFKAVTLCLPR